jgi:hypothetical protein
MKSDHCRIKRTANFKRLIRKTAPNTTTGRTVMTSNCDIKSTWKAPSLLHATRPSCSVKSRKMTAKLLNTALSAGLKLREKTRGTADRICTVPMRIFRRVWKRCVRDEGGEEEEEEEEEEKR